MSTATADPIVDEEALVVEKPQSVMFMARRRELRLVKQPIHPRYGPGGIKVGETHGQTLAFVHGRLDVPTEGDFTLENGDKIAGSEVIEFLLGDAEKGIDPHKMLGDVNEGFWVVDQLAPAPTDAEIMAIVNAATDLNAEMLEKIVEQERQGWAREAILTVAEATLEKVNAHRAAATPPEPPQA